MEPKLNIAEYLQRIRANLSEPIDSYKVIDRGWTNLVIEINDQWIFRFVRDVNNRQIALEKEFLPRFSKVSPVKIPEIITSDFDFISYRKIIGERFSPDRFLLFSDSQRTQLIKLLGKFLTCLHNFKFDHQYLSTEPYGGSNFWSDLWLPLKNDLSVRTRDKAEKFFTDSIEQINLISYKKTLVHADLGTNNIIVDYKKNNLSGIIDFGDLCIGDPAADFAGFYRNFGRQFTEELICYYQKPIEKNFWTRIKYEAKRKLFFVVYFAKKYGFESNVPFLVEYIEKIFNDEN